MTYRTIKQAGQHELIIKKSCFITQLQPIQSVDDAQAFIAAVKKTHYKANHNVSAYLLGDDDHIQRATDDGEPSGTAGVPMLTSLQQLQLHDVVAVTTRYFGGIKLGAGGLIRAYADSVVEAVHAVGIIQRVPMQAVTIHITYAQLGAVQHWLDEQAITPSNIVYAENVTVYCAVDETFLPTLQQALTDLLAGQVTIEIGDAIAGWQDVE
ncbi:YigZ family protein [Lacticaseibacillus jixiensis]|uniref:YigZ family protein n=1 Tax=Lacticaseibacillus jixiensis TaxID=3231926 RepID=UPI0036F31D0A